MDLGKLAPWNWFKKEEEEKSVPVARKEGRLPTVWNEPVAAFERIHRDFARMMDRLFDDLGLPLLPPTSTGQPILSPRVDIRAGDEEYTLSLELPGLDEKSVDVELSGDTLTVKAEKKREEEKQEGGYLRRTFVRTLSPHLLPPRGCRP